MSRLTQRLGLTRYEADEYYKTALQAYEKRQLEEAILAMEQAIILLPDESEYYATRGLFYLEDSIHDKASADFEAALQRHPYEPLAHYGRGVIAYRTCNWDEALAHFSDAYRADPDRPETLYYLALVCHRKGQNARALALMQQAQTLFEQRDDRRRIDAGRWVKTLEKLAEQEQLPDGSQ
jgi:tetratricopeptide (TPR) repeat protein